MELILLVAGFLLTVGAVTAVGVRMVSWAVRHRAAVASRADRIAQRLPGRGFPGGWDSRTLSLLRALLSPAGYLALSLVAGMAVTMAAAVITGKLVENVTAGDGLAVVDHPAAAFISGHRSGALTTVMRMASAVGSPAVVTSGALAVGVVIWVTRHTWVPLLLMAVTSAGSAALAAVFKDVLGRPRPPAANAIAAAGGYGFPSGHALTAAAVLGILAVICAHWLPRRRAQAVVWPAAAMTAALIGVSRVYLGVHWITDVLGGWIFGIMWLAVVLTAWAGFLQRHQAKNPLPDGRLSR
jgi:membrane-associated phospholipid phosphatase